MTVPLEVITQQHVSVC